MKKQSCVIAFGDIDGKKFMFKNRDRNYVPELKIYHTRRNGVEMVYFKDEHTGWVEGINEHGIAVANSALMVLWDEKEGAKSKKKDNSHLGAIGSMDANRILKTLECKNMGDALDTVIKYDGGVRGHTFISDGNVGKSIEHTAKHEAYITDLIGNKDKYHARSNHGIRYPEAGYTLGENAKSSRTRLKKVLDLMSQIKEPEDLVHGLYEQRGKDFSSPHNVVRKTDNMFTSSQLIYDFDKKKITLYLIPEDCDYLGYEKTFDDEGVCSFEVKRISHYEDDGSFTIKPIKTNPSRVASLKMASQKKKYEIADKEINKVYIDRKLLEYLKDVLFVEDKKIEKGSECYEPAFELLAKFFESKKENLYEWLDYSQEEIDFDEGLFFFTGGVKVLDSEVVGELMFEEVNRKTHLTGTMYFDLELDFKVSRDFISELDVGIWHKEHLMDSYNSKFMQRDFETMREGMTIKHTLMLPFNFDISKHKPLEIDYMLFQQGRGTYNK